MTRTLTRRVKTDPPTDQVQIQMLTERGFTATRIHPERRHLEPLKTRLLEIGGWAVILPVIEEDYQQLMERGHRFPGKSVSFRGKPCGCHSNSAFLWHVNRETLRICTGYALSRDGLWRQHSWCLKLPIAGCKAIVVETTVKRVQYFGFELSDQEQEQFLFEHM